MTDELKSHERHSADRIRSDLPVPCCNTARFGTRRPCRIKLPDAYPDQQRVKRGAAADEGVQRTSHVREIIVKTKFQKSHYALIFAR